MVIKSLVLSMLMSLAVGATTTAVQKGSPNIAATQYVWEAISDVNDLSSGDIIAIGNGSRYLCDSNSDVNAGNYHKNEDYAKSYSFIEGAPNIPFSGGSFTLATYGTNENEYRIVSNLDSSRALGMSGNSATALELKASHKTDSAGWIFSSSSSGKMYIQHTTHKRYITKGTASGDIGFRTYSDQGDVKVFKKVETAEKHVTSIEASGYEDIVAYPGQAIDFSSVVITGTYDLGGTTDVTSNCVFSPTVAQDIIGSQTITVTCNRDNPPSITFDITVIPEPTAITYEKVTDISEIDVGSSIVFGNTVSNVVNSTFGSKGPTGVSATFSENKVEFYEDSGVDIITLEQGYTTGTYALKLTEENKYIGLNNSGDLALSSTKNQQSSWNIIIESDAALIKPIGSENRIKYNASVKEFRLYSSTSGSSPIHLYRYNGGGEHVVLSESSHSVYENDVFTLTAEAKLFKATSWSFTANNSNVELTPNGASCKIKGITPGSSIVTVTANGTYSADCVVTVREVTYDVLTGDSYCFLSNDNRFYMSQSLGAVETLDLTNPNNLFSFVRAYKGANTYYIKTSTGNFVEYSGEGSKLGLFSTSSSYWTVSKNADNTYCWETEGRILSLFAKSSTEHYWYLFDSPSEQQSHNKLVGSLTYVSMGYTGAPTKTDYDLGDTFDPTGITSYFVRYETEEHETIDSPFTGEIAWSELETGTSVTGTAIVNGKTRTIEVTGLNISSYSPVELILDASGALTTYYPGQSVDISGLVMNLKYVNSSSNIKYRLLTEEDVTYSPAKISAETTEITVKVKDKAFSASYEITVTQPIIRTTNKLVIGDHVVIAQMSYQPEGIIGGIELSMNASNVAVAEEYEYVPEGHAVYEVVAGSTADSFAFRNIESNLFLQKNGTALQEQSDVISDNASFTYTYNRNDRVSYLTIGDAYVYYNTDANKFRIDTNFDPDYIALDIYSYATTSTVQSITADSSTTQTEFEVGDKFTWTSLVVTANYGNGISNTLPVGSFDITQPDMSTAGTKTITVTYFGKTTSYTIHVSNHEEEIKLIGLRLDNVKDTYYVGDTPVYTAMALYSDDSEVDVTELTTYEFYSLSPSVGQRTCTVTYKEKGQTTQQAQFKYVVVQVPAVDEVTIKDNEITDAQKGSSYQIVIATIDGEVVPETGEEQVSAIHKFTFTSTDSSVATVDNEGNVTFVGLGECYIDVEARSGSGKARLRIFVPGKTTSIDVAESSITIKVGEGYQIIATINPEEARTEKLKYSSNNANIASVSNDGFISGIGEGTTTIYVISEDGSIKTPIAVKVEAAPLPPEPSTSETTLPPEPSTSDVTTVVPPTTTEVPEPTSGTGSTSEGPSPTPVDPDRNVGLIVALIIIGTVAVAGGIVCLVIFTGKKKH